MPIKREIPYDSGHFFITFTCYKWLPLIEITNSYDVVYNWFDYLKQQRHCVNGYVIMPNHVHATIASRKTAKRINKIIGDGKRFIGYEIIKRLTQKGKADILLQLQKAVNNITQRKTLRQQLLEKTKTLGQYVNFVADGNLDMVTSSGFDLAKLPTPNIMGNPVNLRILQGIVPGSLISKVKKPKGCLSLNHQITKHPLSDKSVWTDGITSLSSYQFDELEQGEMYWVRVIAIGGNNQKTYSEEVSQFVNQRNIISAA